MRFYLTLLFLVCACLLRIDAPQPDRRLNERAAQVAERYWSRRFIKCGDRAFVWAARQTNASSRSDVLFFFGEGNPVMTVDGQYFPPPSKANGQKRSDSQFIEWSGRSLMTVNKAGAFCKDCDRDESLRSNLRYSVGLRS